MLPYDGCPKFFPTLPPLPPRQIVLAKDNRFTNAVTLMGSIYTRAYSVKSRRQLTSGKGEAGSPLTLDGKNVLLSEFKNHANKYSREPTALVSVSNRIIDTLNRAFYLHLINGEKALDVWIVFIEVPASQSTTSPTVHQALPLAKVIGLENLAAFEHELVFEWPIPKECIQHKVHLQTLIDRGLASHKFLGPDLQYVSTHEMRAEWIRNSTYYESDPWEIGLSLGFIARAFGARAPTGWIAHQLFYDCISRKKIGDEMESGIDTALIDCWWTDDGFVLEVRKFEEWRGMLEDNMSWDLIDIDEMWNDCMEPHEMEMHDEAVDLLWTKFREDIEARAVEIGL